MRTKLDIYFIIVMRVDRHFYKCQLFFLPVIKHYM